MILVDMDGVIADFEAGIRKYLPASCEVAGLHLPEIIPHEKRISFYVADDYDQYGLREAVIDTISTEGFYRALPAVEGAINGLLLLAEHTEVMICTAPSQVNRTCASEKLEWVEDHLGKEWMKRTIITRDKTWVRGKILLDDRPEVSGSLEPEWCHVIFDAPYNREAVGPRCHTWGQWERLVRWSKGSTW